jgi:hypothetical protein
MNFVLLGFVVQVRILQYLNPRNTAGVQSKLALAVSKKLGALERLGSA